MIQQRNMNQNVADDSSLQIHTTVLKKAAMVFRAINHELRQDLFKYIHKKGRVTVTEIYTDLDLLQAVDSQHLAILRKAGAVITEREGQFIYYSVNYKRLKDIDRKAVELLSSLPQMEQDN